MRTNELRLPSFWKGMSWTNRAAYLCQTHQAKDFSEACSILASLRRPKRQAPSIPKNYKPLYVD